VCCSLIILLVQHVPCTLYQVLSPLKVLARDTAGERRKHLTCGADLHKQLKLTMDTLEKVCELKKMLSHKLKRTHAICTTFIIINNRT